MASVALGSARRELLYKNLYQALILSGILVLVSLINCPARQTRLRIQEVMTRAVMTFSRSLYGGTSLIRKRVLFSLLAVVTVGSDARPPTTSTLLHGDSPPPF